jgi:hypothetical protein
MMNNEDGNAARGCNVYYVLMAYSVGSGNDAEIKAKDPLLTFIEWTLNIIGAGMHTAPKPKTKTIQDHFEDDDNDDDSDLELDYNITANRLSRLDERR